MKKAVYLSIILISLVSCVSVGTGKGYARQTENFVLNKGEVLRIVDPAGEEPFFRVIKIECTDDNEKYLSEYIMYEYKSSASVDWQIGESSILYFYKDEGDVRNLTRESGSQNLQYFSWSYKSDEEIWIYPAKLYLER